VNASRHFHRVLRPFLLAQPSTARGQAGPDLVITMHHTGNFTVGVPGVHTIVVSNIGDVATSDQSVGDQLSGPPGDPQPPGFTFVSGTGSGWSCSLPSYFPADLNYVLCSSFSVIPAGGSAPPITLTVLPTVSGTVTNTATVQYVTGGGVPVHTASDPTIVVAAVLTLPQWAMMALSV